MDPKMKRKSADSQSQGGKAGSKGRPTSRYFGDPRLVSRIEQYLSQNRHLSKINLNLMASQLQKQYGEYARKKQTPFRLSVEKAYNFILDQCNMNQDHQEEDENTAFTKRRKKSEGGLSDIETSSSDSESKSFSSDTDKYKVYKDTNSMNNTLSNLYRKTPSKDNSDLPQKQDLPFFIDKTGDPPRSSISGPNKLPNPPVQESSSGVTTPVKQLKKNLTKNEALKKIVKKTKKEDKKPLPIKSNVTFADVGGNEKTLTEVCKLLVHLKHREVYSKLGVTPPRGFLLHGPPGCGKTLLANAIAGELDLPLIKLAATEVVSGVSGESEEKLRDLFAQAVGCAPCILFLDEIDAITQKRELAGKDMERRIVSQLLACMDELSQTDALVMVIGATNRPDSLDPALRRAGRFDREICLGIPDERAREQILRVLCRPLRLEEGFQFPALARDTPGYVGADLGALTREAAMTAVNRILETAAARRDGAGQDNSTAEPTDLSTAAIIPTATRAPPAPCDPAAPILTPAPSELSSVQTAMSWLRDEPPLSDEQLASLRITMEDFRHALQYVQPSAKREGFATIPGVTWDDIGALSEVRDELQLAVLAPVRHREHFSALGLTNPPGILLAGPPGCGKTMLAKAVANESGINFISVKGPELLNMYVGESERAVRQVFLRARNSAPCVIFFDELDALCPRRSQSGESGAGARVVNQLLTEMDGLEERRQVFIMAATNRPDIIDPAVLRPGRLDKLLYVGLPSAEDRADILSKLTRNGTRPQLRAVSLHALATDQRCHGYTGADMAALVREASVAALRSFIRGENQDGALTVGPEDFEAAFGKVRPSVSEKDQIFYDKLRERLSLNR